ncbi:hypothetical protein [Halomonas elongata]|uniref:hypothetical protein n=1 Tax=Halomonas elongata TaxID=2746 RepID=UPI0023AFF774|nr:hypothetical protein [Halomonas elongata]
MYGNTVRFLMPVTIEDAILEEGRDIIEICLRELVGQQAAASVIARTHAARPMAGRRIAVMETHSSRA